MIARGVTVEVIARAVAQANASYAGNLRLVGPHGEGAPRVEGTRRPRVRWRLGVVSSAAPGGRRSHSGRRVAAACWHAHRDVLAALFALQPSATVETARARYDGRDGFERTFWSTGSANIGSEASPLAYRHACDC